MEEIFRYKRSESENYYKLLGCDQLSSLEQISSEYKIRAIKYHPDKTSDKSSNEEFLKLQRAKEVLCDEELRKSYDTWLNSGVSMCFERWLSLGKNVHHSMHWMTSNKKEPMIDWTDAEQIHGPVHEDRQSNMFWERDDNEMIKRFRNYQI